MTERIIRVLFVCLGNICRSPMAEGIFRQMVKEAGLSNRVDTASAGTGGWHVGEQPHRGTLAILRDHKIDLGHKRSRQITHSDLREYDYIVAMDSENVADIQALFGKRVPRLLEFTLDNNLPMDVPDPYYTGGFEHVYELVEAGCKGLLSFIRRQERI